MSRTCIIVFEVEGGRNNYTGCNELHGLNFDFSWVSGTVTGSIFIKLYFIIIIFKFIIIMFYTYNTYQWYACVSIYMQNTCPLEGGGSGKGGGSGGRSKKGRWKKNSDTSHYDRSISAGGFLADCRRSSFYLHVWESTRAHKIL